MEEITRYRRRKKSARGENSFEEMGSSKGENPL
jgi:hypothetical protein